MRLHFLVEGPSEVELLNGLLPRLIPQHKFQVYPHQGKGKLPLDPGTKPDLKHRGVLDQLPAILRAWGKSFSSDTDRVVLLVDSDDDDCRWLLEKLSELVKEIDPAPMCLFRIAIEEVEAWYLGDWTAIKRAFPKAEKKALAAYVPDSICGSWELFQEVIKDRLERKPYWAQKMGVELEVDDAEGNESISFRKFCNGVRRFAGEHPSAKLPEKKDLSQRARRTAKKKSPKR
ncbi:MAG TPA: DUF4276 family protein [Polyangium sp.]|nr:DUF4276 family protein [Polyangium sp.]